MIVDSFEREGEDFGIGGKAQVIEEAGWRLGFAIRDLPVGPGRDKWLNPLSTCHSSIFVGFFNHSFLMAMEYVSSVLSPISLLIFFDTEPSISSIWITNPHALWKS